MSDLSTYFGNKILRWMAGNAMPSAPATVYLALFDGDPKGAGTEVTDTIRVAGRLALSFAALASGLGNVLDTNADANFGAAAGAVANLSHVAVFDDPAAGNLLWARPLAGGPYNVTLGTVVNFPSADVTFTVGS